MSGPKAPLAIDGSHGEGGGQILRSAVTLSVLTGRALRIDNIRAGRPKPGLAAQHVTSVRAGAAICGGRLRGDEIGSRWLEFAPGGPAVPGSYAFDVAAAREGGSAGAASLVMQTVFLPLALSDGRSRVAVRGGTHMAWSPPFDYLRDVWLPALAELGLRARLELAASGWFPVGKGEIVAVIDGTGPLDQARLRPACWTERGALRRVAGRALAANLPEHIAERMAATAAALLAGLGVPIEIQPCRLRAACPGAGIFLCAEHDGTRCGFGALGERGKPAETVAEEAAQALMDHERSSGAIDRHLADQILLPLAFAAGPSRFTVPRVTRHLETNAWVIERFGLARIDIESGVGADFVTVKPADP